MNFSSHEDTTDGLTAGPELPELTLYFGEFELCPRRLLLLRNGQTVHLGNRALYLLVALATRPFELMEKAELIAFAWPGVVVEECNLRAQIVALRRALGDQRDGAYVITVPGRGYRFVAPVTHLRQDEAVGIPSPVRASLPRFNPNIIGRTEQVQVLGQQLLSGRFVTITGPGGIGKTTVALGVVTDLNGLFAQGVCFLDLSAVTSPHPIPGMLASALGLTSASDNPLHSVAGNLANTHLLLVLDNCEHVLEMIADCVEIILRDTALIYVLVTSREPLHASGEFVHNLAPMAVPAPEVRLTAEQALTFPGIQLFVERVTAYDPAFLLNDHDVDMVSAICRKLDSNALAIEIAAARVRTFGIHALVGLLDGTFRLQMTGRRTSLERHRTLSNALDWTYSMLSGDEQTMLRQLSVFTGAFTLEAATTVIEEQTLNTRGALPLLESLIDKSLLSGLDEERGRRFRLLETTRVYAQEKLTQHRETAAVASRHAGYTLGRLREAGEQLSSMPLQQWLALYGLETDNVRAALNWAYSPKGDRTLGVELTLLSVPLWLRKSLIGECRAWVDKGLKDRSHSVVTLRRQRMLLLTASASVLMLTFGAGQGIRDAWLQTLEDASVLNDVEHQLRALWGLWSDCCCGNQYEQALELADRYNERALAGNLHHHRLLAKRMRATALFYMADLVTARRDIREALSSPSSPYSHVIDVYFDQRIAARCLSAQIQLLDGHTNDALLAIEQNVAQATTLNHPATLWYTLCLSAIPMALMGGNMTKARHFLAMLQGSTARHDLPIWRQFTRCFESIVLIREGEPEAGLPQLGEAMHEMRALGGSPLYSFLRSEYAYGLAMLGLTLQALEVIEETIRVASSRKEQWFLPELLRIKAHLMLTDKSPAPLANVRAVLTLALAQAETQDAELWRCAINYDLLQLNSETCHHKAIRIGELT
ncbi:ATP-binding protein [Pseudomonas sp. LT1P18]|uniref:ATP-binding protein n=1 Tax=Pseudomonas arabinosi TaxID=3398357 RepID=UPI0039EFFEAC